MDEVKAIYLLGELAASLTGKAVTVAVYVGICSRTALNWQGSHCGISITDDNCLQIAAGTGSIDIDRREIRGMVYDEVDGWEITTTNCTIQVSVI